MFKYQQDSVQFNLLSLCRSPLRGCPEKLAESFHAIRIIKNDLETLQPNWQQFTEVHEATIITGPDNAFGVSQDLIDRTRVSEELIEKIENAKSDATATINLYQELVRDQLELQRYYWDELALIGQEDEQAHRRKQDYTSLIYNSIRTLSEIGVLKEIVDEVNENGTGRK
jgi:ubiquitin carboxyl-terminal hydrolase L5